MSDTPLYQQTLSDLLQAARSGVERAEARAAEAQARADRAVREERIRSAFLAEQAEAAVRHALVAIPPLPPLAVPTAEIEPEVEPEVEPEAPPVPSMAELMTPTPGVTRFLDALLGPSET